MAVTYEAGPTGFGLARALTGGRDRLRGGGAVEVERPCGDRVKTDTRDALLLARLLHLGEIVAVRVPSAGPGGRPGCGAGSRRCRADLMRARHRLSKLLLRQGMVYSGGQDWTAPTSHGCAGNGSPTRACSWPSRGLDAMLATRDRRDRLDAAITADGRQPEFTPVVHPAGLSARSLGADRVRLAVEIGDWQRFTGDTIGAYLGLVPTESSSGATAVQGRAHQDRQQPRPPAAGRGGLASPQALPAQR